LVIESAEKKTFLKKHIMKQKIIFHDPFTLDSYDKKKKKTNKTKRIYIRGKRQASQCHLQKHASLSPHV